MVTYQIAVIPGDGIGQEVMPEGLKALRELQEIVPSLHVDYEIFPWGSDYYRAHGVMMPDDALKILESFDAIYFGAVGDPPRLPDHITLNGLILPIRKGFQQYACIRPAKLLPGAPCPLVGKGPDDIDFIVVRENTEGEYADAGGWVHRGGYPQELAVQTAVFTRIGCERIIRFAFELARKRNQKKKVTSITKSNAQKHGMVFWDEIFNEVKADYPDIETDSNLVDAAAMNFIRRPEAFDVLVASNLFADILTDLGAVIMGGMGFAPQRQSQSRARLSIHVRIRPWFSSGHQRPRHLQPLGDDLGRSDDARLSRRNRSGLTFVDRLGNPCPRRPAPYPGPRRLELDQ